MAGKMLLSRQTRKRIEQETKKGFQERQIGTKIGSGMRSVLVGVIIQKGMTRAMLKAPTHTTLEELCTKCNEIAQNRGLPNLTIAQIREELSLIIEEGQETYVRGSEIVDAPRINSSTGRLILAMHERGKKIREIDEAVRRRFGKVLSLLEIGQYIEDNCKCHNKTLKTEWALPERNFLISLRRKSPELGPDELAERHNQELGSSYGYIDGEDVKELWRILFDKKRLGEMIDRQEQAEEKERNWEQFVSEHFGELVVGEKSLKGDLEALTVLVNNDERNTTTATRMMVEEALVSLGIFEDFMAGTEKVDGSGEPITSDYVFGDRTRKGKRKGPERGCKKIKWGMVDGLLDRLKEYTKEGFPASYIAKRLNDEFGPQLDGVRITEGRVRSTQFNRRML